MEHDKIILYTTGCPKCRILRQKLDDAGIEFEINTNVDEMVELGFTTVPMLKLYGMYLNFVEAVHWTNDLVSKEV